MCAVICIQFARKQSKAKARVEQGSGPHQLRARTVIAVRRMHTTKGMIDLQS